MIASSPYSSIFCSARGWLNSIWSNLSWWVLCERASAGVAGGCDDDLVVTDHGRLVALSVAVAEVDDVAGTQGPGDAVADLELHLAVHHEHPRRHVRVVEVACEAGVERHQRDRAVPEARGIEHAARGDSLHRAQLDLTRFDPALLPVARYAVDL